jgi:sigma-E factor negative regulatory protein RseC
MTKMTDRGRVREITETTLTLIRGVPSDACFGCMNQECKSGGITYPAANPRRLSLRVGQLVETECPAPLKQALAALLPPALGFIAGYVFTALSFPAAGDPARAAAGVLLMFLAGAARFLIVKRLGTRGLPRVTRVIEG